MKKGIAFTALLCMISILFIGCTTETQSYASILIYNNQQYIGESIVPKEQYPNVDQVGTVTKMVASDQLPKGEFTSNELSKGTKIYQVDENTLLANWNDEQFKLFERKNAKSS